MVKSLIERGIPQIKQYMSEIDKALQTSDVAEHLRVSVTAAYELLDLMHAFGITEKAKRAGKQYHFLKDVYSDEQIIAMLPTEKAPHIPKPRGRPGRPRPHMIKTSFMDEYRSDLIERASSGDGLPALALLGLPQIEAAETLIVEPPIELEPELMVEERKPKPLINIKPFATVKYLPKEFRRLSRTDTRYLKNLMKSLDGCEGLETYNTVFSKFSAIECGRYGEEFYLSRGTNPWDNVRKVTIDHSISDYMVLPTIEANRWASWNDFLTGLKETRGYTTGQYDEMLDKFIESGHKLVEITVENRDANHVKNMLKKKIEKRGIMDQVNASRVGEWIYLEKVE